MYKKIKNAIWKPEGLENVKTSKNKEIIFGIYYKDINIATLELKDGEWSFYYSKNFKKLDNLSPIIDFPDKEKTYTGEDLWPFFTSRIPSLKQPRIQNIIKEKNIDSDDIADLLKTFGERTINNPYKLVTA